MSRLGELAALTSAVGAGVVGGVLFGFSSFVMPALDRLPADRAIEAMRSINREAVTPWFMTALFATAVTALAAGGSAVRDLDPPGARWQLAGSALYLATIAITATFHVPRNNRLASLSLPVTDAAARWSAYAGPWTAGNHLRTITAVAAAACFTLAVRTS